MTPNTKEQVKLRIFYGLEVARLSEESNFYAQEPYILKSDHESKVKELQDVITEKSKAAKEAFGLIADQSVKRIEQLESALKVSEAKLEQAIIFIDDLCCGENQCSAADFKLQLAAITKEGLE